MSIMTHPELAAPFGAQRARKVLVHLHVMFDEEPRPLGEQAFQRFQSRGNMIAAV